jgi:hypothetical protein
VVLDHDEFQSRHLLVHRNSTGRPIAGYVYAQQLRHVTEVFSLESRAECGLEGMHP